MVTTRGSGPLALPSRLKGLLSGYVAVVADTQPLRFRPWGASGRYAAQPEIASRPPVLAYYAPAVAPRRRGHSFDCE